MKHLVLVTVLAVLGAATAASTSSAAAGTSLRLLSVQTSFHMVPQGPPAVGSTMIFTNTIYNGAAQFGRRSGQRVGSAEGVCTIVSSSKAQCTITAHLPNGEVIAAGTLPLSERQVSHLTYAVTGGAGAYAGARGSVSSRDVSQTKTMIEIHLLP